MATISRIRAGFAAKKSGEFFENFLISFMQKKGYKVIQIPSGCRQAGKMLIRVPTPFDFVFVKDKCIFVDAKRTSARAFTRSQITEHQLRHLLDIERKGHLAGYVVQFSEKDQIYFYPASTLLQIKQQEIDHSLVYLLGAEKIVDLFNMPI